MDSIQKFYSDIEKMKKYHRSQNPGRYDGQAVCNQVAELFESNNRNAGALAHSFAEYWLNTYIMNSTQLEEEPTLQNQDKLAAMQSLLETSEDQKDYEALTPEDWKELCQLTKYEAEDLPIDLLNDLMMIFVNTQGLI